MATRTITATANTTTTEHGNGEESPHPLTLSRRIVLIALGLLPAVALVWGALPHFLDGLAKDAAIPVPVYMIAERPMPKIAYKDAVDALAHADRRDGDARIVRGEAAMYGGEPLSFAVSELSAGVAASPASARGWTLLSEAWREQKHMKKAGRALAMAFVLSANDYWLIGRRVQDASLLWPYLDSDTQQQALTDARRLWEEDLLRNQLRALLNSPPGLALATKAFATMPDETREMNRWLAERRRASVER